VAATQCSPRRPRDRSYEITFPVPRALAPSQPQPATGSFARRNEILGARGDTQPDRAVAQTPWLSIAPRHCPSVPKSDTRRRATSRRRARRQAGLRARTERCLVALHIRRRSRRVSRLRSRATTRRAAACPIQTGTTTWRDTATRSAGSFRVRRSSRSAIDHAKPWATIRHVMVRSFIPSTRRGWNGPVRSGRRPARLHRAVEDEQRRSCCA